MKTLRPVLVCVLAGLALASPCSAQLTTEELAIWNNPAFRRQLAESYMAETDIEPTVSREENERMQEVLTLIGENNLDAAATLVAQSRGDATSAVFDFTLGNIHFQKDELEPAAVAYEVAVQKFPKFRRAWRNLGIIYVRLGVFEKALPALTRVIELGGGDATTYGLLGYSYASLENDIASESAYRMAIILDPETADWTMGLARSFFRQERYAEASSLCRSLIRTEPDRADLWMLQANAYLGLGQPLKAAENYELVDRLGASTVDSLTMLGDIYINEGLYDLAVNCYARAMEMDPDLDSQRAVRAAKVLTSRRATKETLALIDRIENARGDRLDEAERKELLMLRARVAVAEGADEEQVRVLEEIVSLDPLDGDALLLLGQHYQRVSEDPQAIMYYERAANIPGHEGRAKVGHAQVLVRQRKYQEALPLLRQAQDVDPRDTVQDYLDRIERLAKR